MGILERVRRRRKEPELRHNCGLAAVFLNEPRPDMISSLLHPVLQTLQNRGQEGVGIGLSNGISWHVHKKSGLVAEILTEESMQRIEAKIEDPYIGVGQTRYSTSGRERGAWQPFRKDEDVLTHNGTFTNPLTFLARLPESLQKRAESDSWIAHQTIVRAPGENIQEKIQNTVGSFEGAYNLVVSDGKKLFVMRDPWGYRPISIGFLPDGQGYVVSSETSAFSTIGVTDHREVREGEGVVIDETGVHTFFVDPRTDPEKFAHCIFELIYFASPDSVVFGHSVTEVRKELGRELARIDAENGFLPDVVVPVQESGIIFAQGYADEMIRQVLADPSRFGVEEKNIPDVLASLVPQTGLVKNAYMGRAFLAPGKRRERAKLKQRRNEVVIKGKKVVVIEDSLVRADTSSMVNETLREGGVGEVHFRVASAHVRYPCYWGIDTPQEEFLIANRTNGDTEEIRKIIGLDSLVYLRHEQVVGAVVGRDNVKKSENGNVYGEHGFCGACFTGTHAVEVKNLFTKIRTS